MAEEIERYVAKVDFQHKFQKVGEHVVMGTRSPTFFVRNVPFHLDLYRYHTNGDEFHCDLVCEVVSSGFSLKVEYQLSLITSSKTFRSAEFSHTFDCLHNLQRRRHSEILSGEKVVLDDAMTLGLSLWADEPEGIEFKPPKDKLRQELQILEDQVKNEAFASHIVSSNSSDVTFVVNEDSSTFKAHKWILVARSSFFHDMLIADLSRVTGKVVEIRIYDMGTVAFKIILLYIYTGQLGFPKGVKMDLKICRELANAADKYGLPNLKEYAAMAMTEFVSVENAWELLSFATQIKAEAATKALGIYYGEKLHEIKGKV